MPVKGRPKLRMPKASLQGILLHVGQVLSALVDEATTVGPQFGSQPPARPTQRTQQRPMPGIDTCRLGSGKGQARQRDTTSMGLSWHRAATDGGGACRHRRREPWTPSGNQAPRCSTAVPRSGTTVCTHCKHITDCLARTYGEILRETYGNLR
jgi:hypothetical protein